jgi:hypothetical protein
MHNLDSMHQNFACRRFGAGTGFGEGSSGGVSDPPSHTLKNGCWNLQNADSRVFLGGDVNGDAICFRKGI